MFQVHAMFRIIKRIRCSLVGLLLCFTIGIVQADDLADSDTSSFLFDEVVLDRNQWLSDYPTRIPLDIRQDYFEYGNILLNGSFEEADEQDSTLPKYWEARGEETLWINKQVEPFSHEDVYEGKRAIKISHRGGAASDPVGFLSSYMSVIPGNYLFSAYIKLQNIQPLSLDSKVEDAIQIRMYYYDADKNPIPGYEPMPTGNRRIDTTNKAYPFSNYWEIPHFGWGKVFCRSRNYPFNDGDLPPGTHYIRIFFGLKGTGQMWVDNVRLQYSKWNFTPLERIRQFVDESLQPNQRVIPTPKQFQAGRSLEYYSSTDTEAYLSPIIILPSNPNQTEQLAALHLKETLDTVFTTTNSNTHIDIEIKQGTQSGADGSDNASSQLVFSIGRTPLFDTHRSQLIVDKVPTEEPESYFIQTLVQQNHYLVFLYGTESIGTYYAAMTASQLLDKHEFLYHDATIVDFPTFNTRPTLLQRWNSQADVDLDLENIRWMTQYKLNKIYAMDRYSDMPWYALTTLFKEGVKQVGDLARSSGLVELAFMVNPYTHLPFWGTLETTDWDSTYQFSHSNPYALDKLKDIFKIGLEAGAQSIMLATDDHMPRADSTFATWTLYNEDDRKRFSGVWDAHAFMINDLYNWLSINYPGTRFEFCPPWYCNIFIHSSRGFGAVYFRELIPRIPTDVVMTWTGAAVRSLIVDQADYQKFTKLIGKKPMLWDNTLYARSIESDSGYAYWGQYNPGKSVLLSLFEPYETILPIDFAQMSAQKSIYINSGINPLYKIKFMTVADYLWNPKQYDPDRSLWRALVLTFGKQAALALLEWNDTFYRLHARVLYLELNGPQPEPFLQGVALLEKLQQDLQTLKIFPQIDAGLLHQLNQQLIQRENRLKRFESLIEDETGRS